MKKLFLILCLLPTLCMGFTRIVSTPVDEFTSYKRQIQTKINTEFEMPTTPRPILQ
jgi:hypothetical protein